VQRQTSGVGEARKWAEKLLKYRAPSARRGLQELLLTFLPFFLLWAAAWYALSISYFLSLAICIPAAGIQIASERK